MTNQEYQLTKLRAILLNENLPDAERAAAQKQIMKILDLKEDNLNTNRRLKNG